MLNKHHYLVQLLNIFVQFDYNFLLGYLGTTSAIYSGLWHNGNQSMYVCMYNDYLYSGVGDKSLQSRFT